jgi:hypothetical protein
MMHELWPAQLLADWRKRSGRLARALVGYVPATQDAWAVSIQLEPTAVVSIARTVHCVALLG